MPMKRLFVLMLLLSSMTVFAQYKDVGRNQYKVVGKAYDSNIDVLAKMTEFKANIYSVSSIDDSDELLITMWNGAPKVPLSQLQFRAKQAYFDLKEHKTLWTKSVSMIKNNVFSVDKHLYAAKRKDLFLLDSETGKRDFNIGKVEQLVWSDSEAEWVIYLSRSNGLKWGNSLRKIDLKRKRVVWERGVDSKFTWCYVGNLSKKRAVFAGDGLHCVNFVDGSGWNYDITTNEVYILLNSYDRPREDHFSNMLMAEDSASFYFAGEDKVVRLSAFGAKLWETVIEKKYKMGYSMLIDNSENILLISKGFTVCDEGYVSYSKPFFATIDKSTGKFLQFYEMDDKNDKIVDAKVYDNGLFLLVYNMKEKSRYFVKYNIGNFNMLVKRSLTDTDLDMAVAVKIGIIDSGIFQKQGDSLVPFCTVDGSGICTFNQSGVVCFDEKFDNGKMVTMDKLYLYKGESEGMRFYTNMRNIYLTDYDNKLVGELYFPDFCETESSLVFYQDKTLCEISKEQLHALMKNDKSQIQETEVIDVIEVIDKNQESMGKPIENELVPCKP